MAPLLARWRMQLWLRKGLRLLRGVAMLDLALGFVLLGVHVFYRALPATLALPLLALPVLAAALPIARLWPSRAATAIWLDSSQGATGIFSTHLEFVSEQRSASPAALRAFAAWSSTALPRTLARLHDLPALGAGRVLAMLLLCTVLAAAIAMLPGKPGASGTPLASAAPAGNTLLPDSTAESLRVISALRHSPTKPPQSAAAASPAALATEGQAGAAAQPTDPQAAMAAKSGDVQSNDQGSAAGNNAAAPEASATASRAELQARFRDLKRRSSGAATAAASGEALPLEHATPALLTTLFDQEQQLLAHQVAAASFDDASTMSGVAGPVDAAFARRFLQLRDGVR